MNINIELHKIVETLSKLKYKYFTLFIAFICSFNLWFLTIYFFKNDFYINHGLIITLLTTLALTVSWCLLTGISVPKYFLWYMLSMNISLDNNDNSNEENKIIDLFVFSEIILLHSFFAYLTYIFHWGFFCFISIAFWFSVIQFFVIDYLAKSALYDFLKSNNDKTKSN